MFRIPSQQVFAISAILLVASTALVAGVGKDRAALEGLLSKHCYECHDDLTTKGGLNLIDLPINLADHGNFELWQRVFDRVREGEMPPAEEPRPDQALTKSFLSSLEKPLLAADLADKEAKGRVQVRRLTRTEYEHSVHDLLAIDLPLQTLLPEEQATHGFETVAKGQQFSHFNLARYLEVADHALRDAFHKAYHKPKPDLRKIPAAKLGRGGWQGGNYRGPQDLEGRVLFWPITLQFYGRMASTRVTEPGWYRVRLHDVRAVNSSRGVTWGTLRSGACASNEPILYPIGIVEATKEKRDFEFEAWIKDGHMLEFKPNDVTLKKARTGASGGQVGYKNRDIKKEGFEGIELSGITMERIYPGGEPKETRKALFGSANWDEISPWREGKSASREKLQETIQRFAERAFRGPVTDQQIAPYLLLAEEARSGGQGTDLDALKSAYRAILCSPRFLTLVEKPGKLDDFELASRLSYMIWNSIPDEELLAVAAEGKLSDPFVRTKQLHRLLEDPKSERFIKSFTDQWLNLKLINFTVPDRRLYGSFDAIVQQSMISETRAFFADLVRHDRPVRHLVDSKHSFLNERLSRFYGLEKPEDLKLGNGLQKVSLKDPRRGGLVTQGAVLKVTADGTTTSPVIRGTWVAERILGMEIPPPPPGVPAVEPDIRGAVSIRDQLNKHRNSMDCAACHKKLDPGGFALESYDPVGLWRTKYGTAKNAAKVDPSGVTPDGKEFADILEWKSIYREKPEMLTRNLAKQLLVYSTGALIRFSDRSDLDAIVERAAKENFGVRSVLDAVVTSQTFQTK